MVQSSTSQSELYIVLNGYQSFRGKGDSSRSTRKQRVGIRKKAKCYSCPGVVNYRDSNSNSLYVFQWDLALVLYDLIPYASAARNTHPNSPLSNTPPPDTPP